MGKAALSEFLLSLATDREALALYKSFDLHDRRVMMKSAGLTPAQIDAMLEGDDAKITKQIVAELRKHRSATGGGGGGGGGGGNHFVYQIELALPAGPKKPKK